MIDYQKLKQRIKCFIFGHNIIVSYPWIEELHKNGTHTLKVETLRYCNKCKRAFK